MPNRAQIIQRVGEELALVPVGQELETQDQARISDAYDEVYSRLSENGLATWSAAADVPVKVTPYFALMIEEKLLIAYSVPDVRYQRIKLDAGEDGKNAMNRIAGLALPEYISLDEGTDF